MANIRAPNVLCDDRIRGLVVHAAHVINLKTVDIASTFLISPRTVDRILKRYQERGQSNKKQQGGYKPKL